MAAPDSAGLGNSLHARHLGILLRFENAWREGARPKLADLDARLLLREAEHTMDKMK